MRGRAIGLGLLGLGAFLLAAALCVRLLLEPALVKLPLDQKAELVALGIRAARLVHVIVKIAQHVWRLVDEVEIRLA